MLLCHLQLGLSFTGNWLGLSLLCQVSKVHTHTHSIWGMAAMCMLKKEMSVGDKQKEKVKKTTQSVCIWWPFQGVFSAFSHCGLGLTPATLMRYKVVEMMDGWVDSTGKSSYSEQTNKEVRGGGNWSHVGICTVAKGLGFLERGWTMTEIWDKVLNGACKPKSQSFSIAFTQNTTSINMVIDTLGEKIQPCVLVHPAGFALCTICSLKSH